MIKELYYIYQHVDPDTGEIVYVGMGTGSRAWATGTSSSSMRGPMHSAWLTELYHQGYTMGDVAKVTNTLLTRQQAIQIENALIKELKPKYNIQGNPDVFINKKFTETQASEALIAHLNGTPYHAIPLLFELTSSNMSVLGSRMVIAGRNILNRKNEE